jgi:sterol desaturase/sphingolipid hydroxylase (fatty acid hydroxylase superfamily)
MRLSTFGYYADFLSAFMGGLILCVLAMAQDTWLLRGGWLAWLIIGVGLWTVLEYGIHRWLYHGVEFFIRLHDAHHKEPNAYVGAPPFIGIALIFLLVFVPIGLFSLMVASGLTTGVLAGYMAYQLVHHATHFWQPACGTFLYRARLRHSGHHYHRLLGNFGITTVFWDQVFGTAIHASPNPAGAAVRGRGLWAWGGKGFSYACGGLWMRTRAGRTVRGMVVRWWRPVYSKGTTGLYWRRSIWKPRRM